MPGNGNYHFSKKMSSINVNNHRTIVTGASGFIGSSMAKKLVEKGYEVFCLIRKDSDTYRLTEIANKLSIISTDLEDLDNTKSLFKQIRPHAVFNCLGQNGFPTNYKVFEASNISSLKIHHNLLEACVEFPVAKFIHCCSSLVYSGNSNSIKESDPLEPVNYRGLMKLHESNLCSYYFRNYGVPVNIVRIFRAYGPWEQENRLLLTCIRKLLNGDLIKLTNENHKRDYIFIDDLTELMLKAALDPKQSGIVVNCGSASSYSAKEICELIAKQLNKSLIIDREELVKLEDRKSLGANNELAKELLDWTPKVNIETGLSKTVKWYLNYIK